MIEGIIKFGIYSIAKRLLVEVEGTWREKLCLLILGAAILYVLWGVARWWKSL